jgi:DNA-binding NtrC family response regulator
MNEVNLLVVDDDQDTCSALSDVLGECGYTTDVSDRAWDALDLVKLHKYDLVLLDFRLPCMTGVELFEKIRELYGDMQGLLITAYATRETEVAALHAGLRRVVHKPIDVPRLLTLIEQATSHN